MNIPGITRALELDDADWDLAVKLRGLTEHQREQFSAALGPVKAQKKSERIIEHCAACDYTRRAKVHKDATVTGYHEFQPATKKPAGKGGGGKSGAVQFCGKCGTPKDRPAHNDRATSDYHPFESSPSKSARGESLKGQLDKTLQGQRKASADESDDDNRFDGVLAQSARVEFLGEGDNRCQFIRADGSACRLLPDHNIHHLTTAREYHYFVAGKSDAQSAAGGGD